MCVSALVSWCASSCSCLRNAELENIASKTGYRKLDDGDGARAGASNAANLSTFGLFGTLESAMNASHEQDEKT